jgi:hypothetical protein
LYGYSADQTKIDGGRIYTGSVTTNALNFTPVTGSSIVATINASSEGIKIAGNKITIDGAVTFGTGYDPSTKATPTDVTNAANGAVTTATTAAATDAQTKATAAQNAAISAAGTAADTKVATAKGDLIYAYNGGANRTTTVIHGANITTGTVEADRINTSNYAEINGFPITGAKLANTGTSVKVAFGALQTGCVFSFYTNYSNDMGLDGSCVVMAVKGMSYSLLGGGNGIYRAPLSPTLSATYKQGETVMANNMTYYSLYNSNFNHYTVAAGTTLGGYGYTMDPAWWTTTAPAGSRRYALSSNTTYTTYYPGDWIWWYYPSYAIAPYQGCYWRCNTQFTHAYTTPALGDVVMLANCTAFPATNSNLDYATIVFSFAGWKAPNTNYCILADITTQSAAGNYQAGCLVTYRSEYGFAVLVGRTMSVGSNPVPIDLRRYRSGSNWNYDGNTGAPVGATGTIYAYSLW